MAGIAAGPTQATFSGNLGKFEEVYNARNNAKVEEDLEMKKVVTFGEIMGRLAAPANLRLRQTRALDVTYAGAEASVAASICNFGGKALK